jgi:phenylacetate-CoA ligase
VSLHPAEVSKRGGLCVSRVYEGETERLVKYRMTTQSVHQLFRKVYHMVPEAVRLGGVYREQQDFIVASRSWDKSKVGEWQERRIVATIEAAYRNSAYYRSLLDSIGAVPADFKGLADLGRFPILTKQNVQTEAARIVFQTTPRRKLKYGTTSGSTGVPVGVYRLRRWSDCVEKAFVHDIWGRFGYRSDRRHLILRGHVTERGIMSPFGRNLMLSSYDLTEDSLALYDSAIRRFSPEYIQAYPSSISALCGYMRDKNLPPYPSLRLVMCSSETLFPFQTQLIMHTLAVPVCNLYGNSEGTVIASNCPHSERMHFYPQYGVVELLAQDGRPCSREGELGQIVTTSFTNPIFPLIRYATGDYGIYSASPCTCGWNYMIVDRIEGRAQDFIVSRTLRKVSIAALNIHSGIYDKVLEFQFHQRRAGQLALYVVPKPGFTDADRGRIRVEVTRAVGPDVDLVIDAVEKLDSRARGKHSFLLQELNMDSLSGAPFDP